MNELILEFLEYDKQQIALEQSMINTKAMLEQFDPELADMIYTHEAFEFIREAQEIENLSDLDKTIDRLIERPHATSFVKRIATVLAKIAAVIAPMAGAAGGIAYHDNVKTLAFNKFVGLDNATNNKLADLHSLQNIIADNNNKIWSLRSKLNGAIDNPGTFDPSRYSSSAKKAMDTINNIQKDNRDLMDKLRNMKSEYDELINQRDIANHERIDTNSKMWKHILTGLGLGALSVALIYSGYKLYCYFVKKSAQKMLTNNGIDPKDKKATLQFLIQESEKLKSKLKTDEEKEKCEKTKQELEEMLSKIE